MQISEFLSLSPIYNLYIYAVLKRLRTSTSVNLNYIPASVINGCSEIFMRVHRFIFDPSLSQKNVHIVISSQVLFHDGSLLPSMFNTQLLITVHNSSRILTHV
jgi:predicted RNA methylase